MGCEPNVWCSLGGEALHGNGEGLTNAPSITVEEQAEFDLQLDIAREHEARNPVRQVDGKDVIWCPQPGSQTEFMECPFFETLFHGTRGNGKLQPLDSLVRTRMGWTRMGDLQVGSMVMTPRGKLVPVTHVFEHRERAIYRVTLRDGSSTLAGDEHLWKFRATARLRKAHDSNWHVDDTLEMRRRLELGQAVMLPTVDPLPFRSPGRLKRYPIDPYLLGMWLGDGHAVWRNRVQAVGFTSHDQAMLDYAKGKGFVNTTVKGELRLYKKNDHLGIWSALAKLRLAKSKAGTKFVPGMYRDGPIEVRTAVLQGLMDTDGTCDPQGHCSFTSVSEQLASDVQYIARSLGAKATMTRHPSYLNGVRYQDHFDVYIQPAGKFEPFRLERKQKRVYPYMHKELCQRVESIEFVGNMDARCIRIDDLEHLYVTDDFIVTHNTDSLLMSFAQHVGKYGQAWRGVIFRQTYPQLADVVAKSEKWFRLIFPSAKFNRSGMRWEWPTGEQLLLRHMARPEDYWNYHGHEMPFIGWEELTAWSSDECFKRMFSCCRSSTPNVPRMIRSTTNPYGVGMNWVKERYKLHGVWWKTVMITDATDLSGKPEPDRCAIHGHIDENRILMAADPDYKQTIAASASNEAMGQAWLNGSWDLMAGGMFDDVWTSRNIVPPFKIPDNWRVDRSFDWGSTAPFSVGWWAESDGSDLQLASGQWVSTVRGDLFRVREWYGWTGRANEGVRMLAVDVAKGIVERELLWGWRDRKSARVKAGPADSAIFAVENGMCIAQDMQRPVRIDGNVYDGIGWTAADKRPGSRKMGWEMMRKMISNVKPGEGGPRENPGLFIMEGQCDQFMRTVLSLPRDEKNLDDVDKNSENHVGDEVRYRVRAVGTAARTARTVGMY